MAKREVPDFDRVAAFDEALARQNPDLVARLGKHEPLGNDAPLSLEPPTEAMLPAEPVLKAIGPSEAAEKRASKRHVPRRGVVARANGKQLRRLTVYVELGLAHRLRKHCFEHELNLSEVAAKALEVGLEALIKSGR